MPAVPGRRLEAKIDEAKTWLMYSTIEIEAKETVTAAASDPVEQRATAIHLR